MPLATIAYNRQMAEQKGKHIMSKKITRLSTLPETAKQLDKSKNEI